MTSLTNGAIEPERSRRNATCVALIDCGDMDCLSDGTLVCVDMSLNVRQGCVKDTDLGKKYFYFYFASVLRNLMGVGRVLRFPALYISAGRPGNELVSEYSFSGSTNP